MSQHHGTEGLTEKDLEEISKGVGNLVDTKLGPVQTEMKTIQDELSKLSDRGDVAPIATKVSELEKKLVEREERLNELLIKNENELRLVKADLAMARRSGGSQDLSVEDQDWGGCFVADMDGLRNLVYSYAGRASGEKLERAIDTADIASAGALPAETADRFIDHIVSEQATLSRITTRRMLSPSARLDEIRVATRQLVRASEGTAPSLTDGVSFAARTLNTEEVIWAEDITLSFLEDNIERANAEGHIVSVLGRQFGEDLNDLAANGVNDTGPGGFVDIRQGLYSYMNSIAVGTDNFTPRAYDASSDTTVSAVFRGLHAALQQRYKARTDLGFFVPTGTAERYADEVQQRETNLGDQVLINGFPSLRYFGRPVWPEPHLSNAAAGGNARPYLTSTQNMVFGVHRNIRIDGDFRPRRRAIEYTISGRIGYQLAVPYLFVRTTDVVGPGLR